MNENLQKIIKEELTRQDIRTMISDKLNSYIKKNEIENEIRKIVPDILEDFFKMMYNKRGFWKNNL